MKPKPFTDMQCSIARSLDLVGSWWSLLIIRDAMLGATRFKHFEKSLGIAKNTLTTRLNDLVVARILEKGPAADGTKYEDYRLTEKGRELGPILLAFSQWGDKWAAHEKGPTFSLVDAETNAEIPPIVPRRENGDIIPASQLVFKPLAEQKAS